MSAFVVYLHPEEREPFECDPLRFRLTYAGQLLSSQRGDRKPGLLKHKHELRKHFHKQLKLFWQQNNFLRDYVVDLDMLSEMDRPVYDRSLDLGGLDNNYAPLSEYVANQNKRNGFRFVPLVREAISLSCELDIILLKKDDLGGALQSGDLDNRVKTLIDGLKMPKEANENGGFSPGPNEDPFYVLLDDDSGVSGLRVETDNLLFEPQSGMTLQDDGKWVNVMISVSLRPNKITHFNLAFS